jgi:hypothetical protein
MSGKIVPDVGSTHRRTDTGLEQPDNINAATEAQNDAGTAADFFTLRFYRKSEKRVTIFSQILGDPGDSFAKPLYSEAR